MEEEQKKGIIIKLATLFEGLTPNEIDDAVRQAITVSNARRKDLQRILDRVSRKRTGARRR